MTRTLGRNGMFRHPKKEGPLSQFSLYRASWCGFCSLVERAVVRLGLEVELRDIDADAGARADLFEATGRETVPCLRVEGEEGAVSWIHESAVIIGFLEERAGAR